MVKREIRSIKCIRGRELTHGGVTKERSAGSFKVSGREKRRKERRSATPGREGLQQAPAGGTIQKSVTEEARRS